MSVTFTGYEVDTTIDLQGFAAADLLEGASYLVSRPYGTGPDTPSWYTYWTGPNIAASIGTLFIRPFDGLGFWASERGVHYSLSAPPDPFSLPNIGAGARSGNIRWVQKASNPDRTITWEKFPSIEQWYGCSPTIMNSVNPLTANLGSYFTPDYSGQFFWSLNENKLYISENTDWYDVVAGTQLI